MLHFVRFEKSHVNNFAILHAIHIGPAPINSVCKRALYIYIYIYILYITKLSKCYKKVETIKFNKFSVVPSRGFNE